MTTKNATEITEEDHRHQQLLVLVRLFLSMQKMRVGLGLQIGAAKDGRSKATAEEIEVREEWVEKFQKNEKELLKDIKYVLEEIPVADDFMSLKGVSIATSAKIMAHIDIYKASSISALWRYAGQGVSKYWIGPDSNGKMKVQAPLQGWKFKKNGDDEKVKVFVVAEPKAGWVVENRRDQLVSGYLSPFNANLKTACYLMAQNLMRANSPYRFLVYDPAKEAYLARDWTAGRSHMAAQRKMIKIVLSHLWARWRVLEGLPIREPYSHAKLGHQALITPEECGWVGLNDENGS